jgi:hypothetical protein
VIYVQFNEHTQLSTKYIYDVSGKAKKTCNRTAEIQMIKLETRNIFIDTSVFIGNSYGTNDKFKQLAKLANKELVKIWVSKIILNELRKNIERDLNSSKDIINEYIKNLNSKARILKSIDEYKPYFDLPKVNIAVDINRFNDNIDSFIKESKAQIVPHDLASINDIVDNYFSGQFPFNRGEKKHEFPDAIILSSIDNWCKKNNSKIYILSNDNDILGYKSKYVIPTKDLSGILNLLNRELETKERLDKIDRMYLEFESELRDEIESSFLSEYDTSLYDFEIEDISVTSIILGKYDITFINDREVELEVNVFLEFIAEIEYNDYSSATHDTEDDVWYNVELVTQKIEKETNFPVTINIDLNPPAGPEFAVIKTTDFDFPSDLITEELDGYFY